MGLGPDILAPSHRAGHNHKVSARLSLLGQSWDAMSLQRFRTCRICCMPAAGPVRMFVAEQTPTQVFVTLVRVRCFKRSGDMSVRNLIQNVVVWLLVCHAPLHIETVDACLYE